MRHIPLNIHLRFFSLCRSGQRNDPKSAGAHPLGDRFDDTALSRTVASFEDNTDFFVFAANPFLKLYEFHVQSSQFFLVLFSFQLSDFGASLRICSW